MRPIVRLPVPGEQLTMAAAEVFDGGHLDHPPDLPAGPAMVRPYPPVLDFALLARAAEEVLDDMGIAAPVYRPKKGRHAVPEGPAGYGVQTNGAKPGHCGSDECSRQETAAG